MIEYKNINLTLKDKIIFKNFNLCINENEKILLNTPSGSGKTTLVKMLLGIVKINSGEIYFNNKLLSPSTKDKFRKNISYISQDVDLINLITKDLIKEILSYKVNKHIKYNEEDIINMFKKFDLDNDHLNKKINELSGGERARVGLIIALLLDRKIIILDEITAGLDEKLKNNIIDYISNLQKTVIIISHDKLWQDKKDIKIVGWDNE